MTRILTTCTLVMWTCCTIGCGNNSVPESRAVASDTPQLVDSARYLLTAEPEGAVGVIAAREEALDQDEIVLVGRVGGRKNPWIDGRAAFTMIDASMTIADDGEGTEEGEICMDDCCASVRVNCTTLVKLVDRQGRVLTIDARKLLDADENDMVVVRGHVQREEGNFSVVANGVYVRR